MGTETAKPIKQGDQKVGADTKPPAGIKYFIEDTKAELKHIQWPNQDTVVKATILILAIVILSTVFVGGLDALFVKLFFIINEMKQL